MKKMIFTLAMIMGLGTTATFANNIYTSVEVSVQNDEFSPIEVKDLPQAVQETLAKNFEGQTVKAAAVATNEEAGTTTYKVTLENTEGAETTVYLSDKGEILE